jgi:lipopolysaccharide/colanic/teichoic acid biosynthesis glycosyltransferase
MPIYSFLKRGIDIAGATLGLLCLAPFLPLIVLAVKAESRGPAFVKLPRVSRGRVVLIYKFRTMVDGAHAMKPLLAHLNERTDGPFFKIKNDPRLTRAGKILRKFRLDEFPQLVNVLEGKLSLVGPRPHEVEEVARYPEEYKHLIFEKAGVTGLSQVSGASGLPFLKELELDSVYVREKSLLLDIKIIAKTVVILFVDPTGV